MDKASSSDRLQATQTAFAGIDALAVDEGYGEGDPDDESSQADATVASWNIKAAAEAARIKRSLLNGSRATHARAGVVQNKTRVRKRPMLRRPPAGANGLRHPPSVGLAS